MKQAEGDANAGPSRVAGGGKLPPALQQFQEDMYVVAGPLASAAPNPFAGITAETFYESVTEVNAAEELARNEGRQLLCVDERLYVSHSQTGSMTATQDYAAATNNCHTLLWGRV